MSTIEPRVANEMLKIIDLLSPEKQSEIPDDFKDIFRKYKDDSVNINVNSISDVNNDKLDPQTKNYLAFMFLKYLADDDEKEELKQVLKENEEYVQTKAKEKYNPDDVFKDNVETQIQTIESVNWWNKILNKIRSLFK
ncbi:MAG: hypothetical protein IKN74_02660 [Clostridia bacterium]|nr:hypothetical protein [Clostridia bacterium]